VVNVASKCGLTPQYKGLQSLYEKYKNKDFEVVGFPCNQFNGQEPGTDDEIASFCTLNYNVSFPLMKKSDVNGDGTNEVFKWLKSEKQLEPGKHDILWNFEKFLIDKEGNVYNRYSPRQAPEGLEDDIQKLLA